MKVNLYFDFVKKQGQIIIGAVAYEQGKNLRYLFKKVERLNEKESNEYNQFHATIKALNLAVNELGGWMKDKKGGVEVLLINQNELVFKWLVEQNYDLNYKELFEELEGSLLQVLEFTDFGFMVINGKENKAKKILKNEVPDKNFQYRKLDFKDLREKLEVMREKQDKKVVGGEKIVRIEKFRI